MNSEMKRSPQSDVRVRATWILFASNHWSDECWAHDVQDWTHTSGWRDLNDADETALLSDQCDCPIDIRLTVAYQFLLNCVHIVQLGKEAILMIIIVEVDKNGPNAQLTLQINNADNSLSIKRLLLSVLRMQKWHLISEQCDLNQCTLGVNDVQSKMF